ncbi:MAG: vWA domain-containing protein [Thermoguttaceae bacterium]
MSDFVFEYPQILSLFWAVPCVFFLLFWKRKQEKASSLRFCDENMQPKLIPHTSSVWWGVRTSLVLLAVSSMIIAAARPKFGIYFQEVTQRGADIFVLLDSSRSMLAEDVAPNRLIRAKSDILDLIEKVKGDRIGLITFAGRPMMLVPLTNDIGFFRETLEKVDTDTAPAGGTSIGDAIRLALRSLPKDEGRDRVILLLTDGEDHESDPIAAARIAEQQGVKIYPIAIGDNKDGGRIPITDSSGKRSFLKFQGDEVRSKVDIDTLKEIASISKGAFLNDNSADFDLGKFYNDNLSQLQQSDLRTEKRKQHREQFQLFVAVAVCAMFLLTCGRLGRNLPN